MVRQRGQRAGSAGRAGAEVEDLEVVFGQVNDGEVGEVFVEVGEAWRCACSCLSFTADPPAAPPRPAYLSSTSSLPTFVFFPFHFLWLCFFFNSAIYCFVFISIISFPFHFSNSTQYLLFVCRRTLSEIGKKKVNMLLQYSLKK